MKFSKFEALMSERGINTLAEIARTLNSTPQAVSNWKARDQVPNHIIVNLNNTILSTRSDQQRDTPLSSKYENFNSSSKDTIALSDILLTMAEQLKLIILIPFITIFIQFTYIVIIDQPLYESTSTILLPNSQANLGGLSGLASQFGVTMSSGGANADLSSPSLFPELISSRTFVERILDKTFYTEKFGKELPLLAIFTYGDDIPLVGRDTLIQNAMSSFTDMVSFSNEGSFSELSVKALEPRFARDLNKVILEELQELNRYFKSQHVDEKINFINNRIETVENELLRLEKSLQSFMEKNRQISSPALQIELERITREVEIQKGIYLTLKQQLELTKIDKIQESSIVQILDYPQIPLGLSNKKSLKKNVLLAGILGIIIAVFLGFTRSYLDNNDMTERRKLRRVKSFMKKKSKDVIFDKRIYGILGAVLVIGLPYYVGHESKNPVFFGMYSPKLMLLIILYILALTICICAFIFLSRRKI